MGKKRMLAMIAAVATAASAVKTEEVELSLQDLMNLKIDVGTLTGMARNKIPVSLTTITAEDIALTPARNINDLIETYVPGATYTLHSESDHIGMRGIMSDRNSKFLLLVNGYQMAQSAHDGAMSELQNWDLNDVDRIEVIRGPGSVTYGPGAIMGVVNIVTKNAGDNPGLRVGTGGNVQYRSVGGYASYGKKTENFQIYSYGSLVRTQGQEDPRIFVAVDSISGYTGPDGSWLKNAIAKNDTRVMNAKTKVQDPTKVRTSYGGPISAYFGDFQGLPQGKLMTDAKYKEFRLSARYTNSGNTQLFAATPAKTRIDGEDVDNYQLRIRQYLIAGENEHQFNDIWKQTTKVSWNDQDFQRWFVRDTLDAEYLRNYSHNFSEKHFKVQSLAQLSPSEKFKFALGAEYSRNIVAAPWFLGSDMLRLGDKQDMFGGTGYSSDSAANARRGIYSPSTKARTPKAPDVLAGAIYDTAAIFVGDGWSTNSYGILGEANLELHPLATILLSGRADKDDYSNWGFSPRVALISEINERNVLKLIWQRSVRMNNMEAAYLENRAGSVTDPEVLMGLEGIYNWQPLPELSVQTSGFYNDLEILAFNRNDSKTKKVGDLQLGGFEFEAKYTTPRFTIGFNESYVKQLDFALSSDTSVKSSGISYSDFRAVLESKFGKNSMGKSIQYGTGEELNNWSKHASKLFANWKPVESVTLHLDTRVLWGFQGGLDGLSGLEAAVNALPVGTLNGKAVTDSVAKVQAGVKQGALDAIAAVREENIYDADFRLNASAAWRFLPWASTTVYCQNLLGSYGNKRYAFDAGNDKIYPSRANWVEEPRTFGLRLDATIPGT
jgi:outer membrane receptor protein involved in Fe transport